MIMKINMLTEKVKAAQGLNKLQPQVNIKTEIKVQSTHESRSLSPCLCFKADQ